MDTLKKILAYALFIPLVLPLVLTPDTLFPWHFGKTMYFQMYIGFLAVVGVWYFWKYPAKGRVVHLTWLDIAVVFFLFVYLLAAVLGVNPEKSFFGDIARAQGVLTLMHFGLWYALLRTWWQEERLWTWGSRIVIWVAVVVAFTGLFQRQLEPWLGLGEDFITSHRISGIIGNPAFLASYLLLPLVMCVMLLLQERKRVWKINACVALVILLFALYETQTRSVMVGIAAGVGFAALLLFAVYREHQKKIALALLGGVVLLGVAGYLLYALHIPLPRIVSFSGLTNAFTSDSTRLWAWGSAFKGVAERPLLGWGPTNFDYVFDLYYDPRFYQLASVESTWDMPHNVVLQSLVDAGALGGIAFFGVLAAFFVTGMRCVRKSHGAQRAVFVVLLSGMCAYVVHDLFLFETSNTLLLLGFFGALLSHHGVRGGATVTVKVVEHPLAQRLRSLVYTSRFFVFIVVCILFIVAVRFEYAHLRYSQLLLDADVAALLKDQFAWGNAAHAALAHSTPTRFEGLKFLVGDLTELDRSVRLNKVVLSDVTASMSHAWEDVNRSGVYDRYVPYYLWEGQWWLLLGEFVSDEYYARVVRALDKAHTLSPQRQDVVLLQTKRALLEKEFDVFLALHRRLLMDNPGVSELYWLYGLGLVASGDIENGARLADKALRMDGRVVTLNNVFYVGDLYAQQKQYASMIDLYEYTVSQYILGDHPLIYARLAAIYAELGENEKALYTIEKAVQFDPSLQQEAELFIANLKSKK